jgi:hypothetical protein
VISLLWHFYLISFLSCSFSVEGKVQKTGQGFQKGGMARKRRDTNLGQTGSGGLYYSFLDRAVLYCIAFYYT